MWRLLFLAEHNSLTDHTRKPRRTREKGNVMPTYKERLKLLAHVALHGKLSTIGGTLTPRMFITSRLPDLIAKLPDSKAVKITRAKFDFPAGRKGLPFFLRAECEVTDKYLLGELLKANFPPVFSFRAMGDNGELKPDALIDRVRTPKGSVSVDTELPEDCEAAITAVVLESNLGF